MVIRLTGETVLAGQARFNGEGMGDNDLVRLTLSGEHKAYETLVRRYQKLVYNMVFQMVRSHEQTADLTQEAFLRAFRGLASFKMELKFKPWLLRIANNTCLNHIRDTKQTDSLDQLLEENPLAEPPSAHDVEKEVEFKISQQQLIDALQTMTPRQRQVFVLRHVHDLTYEDIASITGEPVSTIKPLLFRIRERLRKLLSEREATTISDRG